LGKKAIKRPVTTGKTAASRRAAKAPATSRVPKEKDVVLAAAERLASAIRRGNKTVADKLLAREFTFIDAAGKQHSRRAVLAQLRAAPNATAARVKVRTYGAVAVVTGASKSAQARRRNDLFAVDIWVQGNDGWKALVHHNNVLAQPDTPLAHPPAQPRPADARPAECNNPCTFVPYQPKSQAERDIITAFQTLEQAVTRNDADEWVKHVADEFLVYRTGQHPTDKALRVDFINRQRAVNGESFVAEVEWMKLWVIGDAAVMRADHVMPGDRRPPYRATRVWVKREGHWRMALSQQTTIAR
jgi:hypothetical protein